MVDCAVAVSCGLGKILLGVALPCVPSTKDVKKVLRGSWELGVLSADTAC
jgi:hypothetical protein